MPSVDVSHIKMDDRKRSIADTDEYPSKRQATAVNGHVRMSDPDKEKDIEVCASPEEHPQKPSLP